MTLLPPAPLGTELSPNTWRREEEERRAEGDLAGVGGGQDLLDPLLADHSALQARHALATVVRHLQAGLDVLPVVVAVDLDVAVVPGQDEVPHTVARHVVVVEALDAWGTQCRPVTGVV